MQILQPVNPLAVLQDSNMTRQETLPMQRFLLPEIHSVKQLSNDCSFCPKLYDAVAVFAL
jgi:hypothetical protein